MSLFLNGTFAFYQLLSKFSAWEGITWRHLWMDETAFTIVRVSQEPTYICYFAQVYGLRNTAIRIQMVLPGDSLHPGQRLPSLTRVVTSTPPHILGATTAVGRPERAPTRRSASQLPSPCLLPSGPMQSLEDAERETSSALGTRPCSWLWFFLPPLTSPCSDGCSVRSCGLGAIAV